MSITPAWTTATSARYALAVVVACGVLEGYNSDNTSVQLNQGGRAALYPVVATQNTVPCRHRVYVHTLAEQVGAGHVMLT